MGLRPQEFYRLTPHEYDQLRIAAYARQERELKRQAMWVAHLMNATGNFQEPVTVDALTGVKQSEKSISEAALRQRAEERKAQRLKERAARGR